MAEIKLVKLEVGKEYIVNHRQKGKFSAICLIPGSEDATFEITEGQARYMSGENRGIGEHVTVKKCFCTFTCKKSSCIPTEGKSVDGIDTEQDHCICPNNGAGDCDYCMKKEHEKHDSVVGENRKNSRGGNEKWKQDSSNLSCWKQQPGIERILLLPI